MAPLSAARWRAPPPRLGASRSTGRCSRRGTSACCERTRPGSRALTSSRRVPAARRKAHADGKEEWFWRRSLADFSDSSFARNEVLDDRFRNEIPTFWRVRGAEDHHPPPGLHCWALGASNAALNELREARTPADPFARRAAAVWAGAAEVRLHSGRRPAGMRVCAHATVRVKPADGLPYLALGQEAGVRRGRARALRKRELQRRGPLAPPDQPRLLADLVQARWAAVREPAQRNRPSRRRRAGDAPQAGWHARSGCARQLRAHQHSSDGAAFARRWEPAGGAARVHALRPRLARTARSASGRPGPAPLAPVSLCPSLPPSALR